MRGERVSLVCGCAAVKAGRLRCGRQSRTTQCARSLSRWRGARPPGPPPECSVSSTSTTSRPYYLLARGPDRPSAWVPSLARSLARCSLGWVRPGHPSVVLPSGSLRCARKPTLTAPPNPSSGHDAARASAHSRSSVHALIRGGVVQLAGSRQHNLRQESADCASGQR